MIIALLLLLPHAFGETAPAPAQIGCQEWVDQKCTEFQDHKKRADLEFSDHEVRHVRLGVSEFNYSDASIGMLENVILHQALMPLEVQAEFKRTDVIQKIRNFIDINANTKKADWNLEKDTSVKQSQAELHNLLDKIISTAIDQVFLKRFPNAKEIKDLPSKLYYEKCRIRLQVYSDVYRAIWETDPRWLQARTLFEELKKFYLNWIDHHIPNAKERMIAHVRIDSIPLIAPWDYKIIDPDHVSCLEDEDNSYYNSYANRVNICAGYFFGDLNEFTIFHELSHGLGTLREFVLAEQKLHLWKTLRDLNQKLFERDPENVTEPACPKEWLALKKNWNHEVAKIARVSPLFEKVRSCLQYRKSELKPEPP